MNSESPHAPGHLPDHQDTIGATTHVRDAQTGQVMTSNEWVMQRMATEHRPRQECMDELMNALARGDLEAIDAPV